MIAPLRGLLHYGPYVAHMDVACDPRDEQDCTFLAVRIDSGCVILKDQIAFFTVTLPDLCCELVESQRSADFDGAARRKS